MKNLLVAQSGGPTSAINATLAGVLQGVRVSGKVDKVYGAKHGISGSPYIHCFRSKFSFFQSL